MTHSRLSIGEARRLLSAASAMYAYCRSAEYPCGRWYSLKAGLSWARRMR